MVIDGAPATITREHLNDWIYQLGVDPTMLRSLSVDRGAVTAEVYVLNDKGRRFTHDGQNAATHVLRIPIVPHLIPAEPVPDHRSHIHKAKEAG